MSERVTDKELDVSEFVECVKLEVKLDLLDYILPTKENIEQVYSTMLEQLRVDYPFMPECNRVIFLQGILHFSKTRLLDKAVKNNKP